MDGMDGMDGMGYTGPHAPPNDASVGTQILVNGRFAPHLRTEAVHYRLRLLNSSAFSSYELPLSDGRPFVQIGTGDGLLPEPVVRQSILLGPSQRRRGRRLPRRGRQERGAQDRAAPTARPGPARGSVS